MLDFFCFCFLQRWPKGRQPVRVELDNTWSTWVSVRGRSILSWHSFSFGLSFQATKSKNSTRIKCFSIECCKEPIRKNKKNSKARENAGDQVVNLTGWENGANFLDQLSSKVKQSEAKPCNPGLFSTFNWKIPISNWDVTREGMVRHMRSSHLLP